MLDSCRQSHIAGRIVQYLTVLISVSFAVRISLTCQIMCSLSRPLTSPVLSSYNQIWCKHAESEPVARDLTATSTVPTLFSLAFAALPTKQQLGKLGTLFASISRELQSSSSGEVHPCTSVKCQSIEKLHSRTDTPTPNELARRLTAEHFEQMFER